jgi:hypothetical protein
VHGQPAVGGRDVGVEASVLAAVGHLRHEIFLEDLGGVRLTSDYVRL